jgi:hypothetical protein
MRIVRVLLSLALVLAVIAATGCGGGSTANMAGGGTPTGTRASAHINIGDAPADSIVAFELTVTSVVLHGSGGDVSVLVSPTEIELMHNSGTVESLAIMDIPAGTYTGATITVSHPEVKIVDTSGNTVQLNATLASSTADVSFSPNLVVGTDPIVVNFDLNVAASVAISGNNATVTPTFAATTGSVPTNPAEQDGEDGEVEDTGTVTNVSGNNFTIMVEQSSQNLTFATDSSTEFESPLASVASLSNGMVVEVHGVTQTDGSLLAKKVESETEGNQGMEAEGLVVSTTGNPVTQFVIVVQDDSSSSSSAPALGTNLTVNVDGNTQFRIHSHNVDLSGLPFNPTFDATTLSAGQAVDADSDSTSSSTITASRVKLDEQSLTGTVSNFTQNGQQATFTLTVASDSAFASLTGTTTVTVYQQSNTQLDGISSIANGNTVRVRGLLFANSGFQFVAEKIGHP